MKFVCPKCQSKHFIEDEVRFVICKLCNMVTCSKCKVWMNGGYDALTAHYYGGYCLVIE